MCREVRGSLNTFQLVSVEIHLLTVSPTTLCQLIVTFKIKFIKTIDNTTMRNTRFRAKIERAKEDKTRKSLSSKVKSQNQNEQTPYLLAKQLVLEPK